MITVGVLVSDRCQASSVFTVTDVIIAANFMLEQYFEGAAPLFEYQLIGPKARVKAYNGCDIGPLVKIKECERPDIVILPGAFESVLTPAHTHSLLSKLEGVFPTLKTWHSEGTVIASICTGNFILAAAQIPSGRTLTCHWASEKTARQLFPDESFDTDKLLVDHGDVVSAGGAMAVSQLVLYLISRFHSRELALATGKLMMIELNLDHQSRFALFSPRKNHKDPLVAKLQVKIESAYQKALNLEAFARDEGIGERQLARRFKQATGETPLSYLQRYRIEKVKMLLESTRRPANSLLMDVGYEDPTSFRRLFKRYTGLTMQEYRSRFTVML